MRVSLFTLVFFIFFFCMHAKAQFGVSLQYQNMQQDEWYEDSGYQVLNNLVGIELDYWFRLKNYRWEFLPGLSYHVGELSELNGDQINTQRFGVHFRNNFYVLDFEGDCNCPTFSKQNDWFKKAFFLQLSPGASLNVLPVNAEDINPYSSNDYNFELGLGAGFDIGISDLLTLSPYFNYIISSQVYYSDPTRTIEENYVRLNTILVGLRLGFRPDYVRQNGYNNRRWGRR